MTTIVANLECMAADQRITGGCAFLHTQKIHRIKGSLFGFCGEAMLAPLMLKWLAGSRDPLDLHKLIPEARRDDIEFLELSKDGLCFWNGWGSRLPILDASAAIGSGSQAALAALRNGSLPAQAITIACGLDELSGVHVEPHVEMLAKKRG